MTFLKRYSYSAIGLNYFTSTVVILSSIVAIGFTQQIATGPKRCGHDPCFSFVLLLFTYSHLFSKNRNEHQSGLLECCGNWQVMD